MQTFRNSFNGGEHGIISMTDVDRAVKKILNFMNMLLDMRQDAENYDRNELHKAAYEVACECITLL